MILTSIGEIGVVVDGKTIKLRPSLYAMTQLGEPEDIVKAYASVMSEHPHPGQMVDAIAVLYACSPDDIGDIFGGYEPSDNGSKLEHGNVPLQDIIPLAKCLLRHGVTGAYDPLPRPESEEPEFTQEFNARDHAVSAMAHLGLSSEQAWQMTMTELVGAMRAKFLQADTPGANAPSIEEVEETLEWHDRMLATKAAKKS